MYSVTQRISKIKQPYGGFIPASLFFKYDLDIAILTKEPDYEPNILYKHENLHGSVIGLVVDYLVRFENARITKGGSNSVDAFNVSFYGARLLDELNGTDVHGKLVMDILWDITGLDDLSIVRACQVVEYDTVMRRGHHAFNIQNVKENIPDAHTIMNIRELVNRTIKFFNVDPITVDGFTFEDGYTDIVSSGDGDFLTHDTLWDLKVLRSEITNQHTLQLLMYYLLGQASRHRYYDDITKVGFINPRLNKYYIMEIKYMSKPMIQRVKTEVLGIDLKTHIHELPMSDVNRFGFDVEKGIITGYDATSSSKLGNGMNVRIPDKINGVIVREIAEDAFHIRNVSQPIELLYIPDSIQKIGNNAFYGNDLVYVRFGLSLKFIGRSAFSANRIREIVLPKSLTHLDKYVFFGNQISKMDLGKGLAYIGEKSLPCSRLTELYLPDSVKKIEPDGLFNIKLLKSVSVSHRTKVSHLDFDERTDMTIRD